MDTTEDPSNGMIDGTIEANRTGPEMGGTEVKLNVAFFSMPTRAEYTIIGYVENTETSGDRTVIEKLSESAEYTAVWTASSVATPSEPASTLICDADTANRVFTVNPMVDN